MKESLFETMPEYTSSNLDMYIEDLVERIRILEAENEERLSKLEKRTFSTSGNVGYFTKIFGELLPQIFTVWFIILGQAGSLLFASLSFIYMLTYFIGLILN